MCNYQICSFLHKTSQTNKMHPEISVKITATDRKSDDKMHEKIHLSHSICLQLQPLKRLQGLQVFNQNRFKDVPVVKSLINLVWKVVQKPVWISDM